MIYTIHTSLLWHTRDLHTCGGWSPGGLQEGKSAPANLIRGMLYGENDGEVVSQSIARAAQEDDSGDRDPVCDVRTHLSFEDHGWDYVFVHEWDARSHHYMQHRGSRSGVQTNNVPDRILHRGNVNKQAYLSTLVDCWRIIRNPRSSPESTP